MLVYRLPLDLLKKVSSLTEKTDGFRTNLLRVIASGKHAVREEFLSVYHRHNTAIRYWFMTLDLLVG